ncbi:family 78 glycoside hydrolase catalytic domain [Thermoactinospora rubra]|uniref:alpha-L-rhamnosidase-related protein n=1 Tax=Thermoactinospora rubra TaxID=1088767 RepID=UPI000A0FB3BD|nr:family 78 glycoside hydrolase catalytic domain [Thermoactinospora rubra]
MTGGSDNFAGIPLIPPALTRTGHLEEAYLMLMETGCPSFLHPVTMGAPTIWERWDAVRPDSTGITSLNHYALDVTVPEGTHTLVELPDGRTARSPAAATPSAAHCPGSRAPASRTLWTLR